MDVLNIDAVTFDLENLVRILSNDEQLRFKIYEAIPKIIKNYYNNVESHKYKLSELVADLFVMSEFMLVEKILMMIYLA